MSKQALVRKPLIMLAEERQPAGLALHRRVPHMVGANWNQKTMPVVFLEPRNTRLFLGSAGGMASVLPSSLGSYDESSLYS